jgi:hypothetical protein
LHATQSASSATIFILEELPVMKRFKLDAEARAVAAIYAGEVVIFTLGVWHYGLWLCAVSLGTNGYG